MPFDLEALKRHPYAVGTVVIVGGLIVFYVLSSSSSAAPAASGGSSAAEDEQLAQVQAAASVQTNAQSVQLQQQQLEAQVANTQTAASLQANDENTQATLAATLAQIAGSVSENETNVNATTAQQANQEIFQENTVAMQDSVLESQINSGVEENANNNATALAGDIASLNYQTAVASDQTSVALNEVNDETALSSKVIDLVGAAGLNHGTESLENSLTGTLDTALGYPAASEAQSQATIAASASNAAQTSAIVTGLSKLGGSIVGGLLG